MTGLRRTFVPTAEAAALEYWSNRISLGVCAHRSNDGGAMRRERYEAELRRPEHPPGTAAP